MLNKYPIPDKLNALVIVLQIIAVSLCFIWLSAASHLIEVLMVGLVFAVVMNSLYSSIHEADHGILFSSRFCNETAGVVLSMLFPAPFHILRQGHLGHHRRNRTDNEAFDLYFDRDNKLFKYFAWYGIMTGLYWAMIAFGNILIALWPSILKPRLFSWDRTSEVFMSHFNPKSYRIIQLESLAAIVLHFAIVYGLNIDPLHYLLVYYIFGITWSSLQYVHHYQAERDVINGARNLYFFSLIDLIWLHHNLHLTHHQLPTVPWIYLPELAAERGTVSSFILPAYLRMWRGPRRAESLAIAEFTGTVAT